MPSHHNGAIYISESMVKEYQDYAAKQARLKMGKLIAEYLESNFYDVVWGGLPQHLSEVDKRDNQHRANRAFWNASNQLDEILEL